MNRRRFLRASGVSLALPLLDAWLPRGARAAEEARPMRMVCVCASLGLHSPFLFPKEEGPDYELTPYLELLKEHRRDFTLFSGLSHPDQSGSDGHSSEMTWLTAAKHPGLGGFRNTISIDQLAAEKFGYTTRMPCLVLGTSGTSQSYSRGGIMLPAESRPSKVFAELFLDGTKQQIAAQVRKLDEGRSILDALQGEAARFRRRYGPGDRAKIDEYFQSVREMEQRLKQAESWTRKPKPKVQAEPPQDISNESDLIGRMRLLFELLPLALQTDSTRLATVLIQGRNDVPPVPGVSVDHHNLSHHGQDPRKIEQLRLIEEAEIRAFSALLAALKAKQEAGAPILDRTMVLFGSNLGNANAHDPRNLPVVLAGGGFRHDGHLRFDAQKNVPLSNLFIQMLSRLGLEIDQFGSSTSSQVPGLGLSPGS